MIVAINQANDIRVVSYFSDDYPGHEWYRLEVYTAPYLWGLVGGTWSQKTSYSHGLIGNVEPWIKQYKLERVD